MSASFGDRHVLMRQMFQKEDVDYKQEAKGADYCRICTHFIVTHKCRIVSGYIRPGDWCNRFESTKEKQNG